MPRRESLPLIILLLALAACASPVQAVRVEREQARAGLARDAVTTGQPSWSTRNILLERSLLTTFDERPEDALSTLHKDMVAAHGDPDLLFALAELSFLHGEATGERKYSLAAAVYAYAFLFPEGSGSTPGRFDTRVRTAAEVYNWALASCLASQDGSEVVPRGGTFELPFGPIEVAFDQAALRIGERELHDFTPADQLEVRGLATRYRSAGLGVALAASTRPIDPTVPIGDMIGPRVKVPLTALLRIPDARRALVEGRPLTSTLDLHLSWDGESVSIDGEKVPLENESTAALALSLSDVPLMEVELFGFLGRLGGAWKDRLPLASTTPYRPGLIPAVFVHGTASSAARWAQMFNTLSADPEIRKRYQFWLFQYDSGNPIVLSSLRLREALKSAVARLDPEGKDPALRRMVLIGHSQGGLLVKMQAISPGNRLWDAASRKPLSELKLSPETRDLVQRAFFFEPVPEVSRVVFVATPHRGSFVAGRRVIANTVRRLLSLPGVLAGAAADVARNPDAAVGGGPLMIPSAVDNMSPNNNFIKALQEIPIAPGIAVNSIIAVDGPGPIETGDDGVVKYSSAHISPVESEVVVRSPHSTQGLPETIEEVRRILRLHAGIK